MTAETAVGRPRLALLLHRPLAGRLDDSARDAAACVPSGLRQQIVGIGVKNDGVADHRHRPGADGHRPGHELRVNLTV